ncbi:MULTISPECIES: alpha/beta hydrolase [unclassified Streptomyces]|uniref:alpha/beta fold hydrolase n=1 Tax=unclassified Streptomyces TaxID=2593676 RepID=UPI00081F138E|nr:MULTISPECIES: alpha/beta hydrolase [unclassified Streptomyces]MYR26300.1 alpha/beta fold hydrolase [Streptomyces sp. SID4945]SCF00031.1 Pimeloyl-ACP methyl ester carboxylesterase [Streptomyces sp. LcepLS]
MTATDPRSAQSAPAIRIDGPWTHRDVAANGARFHIAEVGEGPLVMLVHGFPQFWWTWREQLTALAAAGYRAVAMDLRGVGGSDRTPRGYDPANLALDITGVIRSLGEPDAALVGHDLGGYLAWTAAVMRPKLVRRLVVSSMPHPRRWRAAMLRDPRQSAAGSYVWGFQRPWVPERQLVADEGALVGELLRNWSGPRLPDDKTVDVYRRAMRIPSTAHCAVEPYRWLVRSLARPDGVQFYRRMKRPVRVPMLHLHGALDPVLRTRSAAGSGEYVEAPYRWRLYEGLGHFPHEEDPHGFNRELIDWLRDPEPDR